MTICAIPARGGSKRLPGKNIRPFFGRPVIAYAIETARDTELFDSVIVSTDSPDVAQVAMKYGAAIHERSKEAASDTATDYDAIADILHDYPQAEWLCYVYPVTPLTDADTIVQAHAHMTADKHVSVCITNGRGTAYTRTGEHTEAYFDAGAFYWIDCEWFRNTTPKEFYSCPRYAVMLEEGQAQDVDTLADWLSMEEKFIIKHISR
jgi:CMP-N-acetylneuraminic acid synthetase